MRSGVTARRRKDSEGGYALLMVFLMAAIVALMLYQQLPRVAFESEREKEQLLIDRGEQYTRAIQLYYIANNRQWPTSIDDLEKKEKRFLRRRYVDPYTGKDEWRIIHTSGGFLTDSLVQKPPGAGDSQSQNAANTTTPTDGQPQVNAAVLQRPSDRAVTPPSGFTPFPNQDPSAQAANTPLPPITLQPQQGTGALPPITLQPGGTNQPGGLPPITLATAAPAGQQTGAQQPGGQQVPGQLRQPPLAPGQNPVAPFPGLPTPGAQPGGAQAGVPPGFRMDANGQLIPITGTLVPGQNNPGPQGFPGQIPGQPTSQQPGNQPGNQNQPGAPGSPNAALNLINSLLTNPRQTTSTPIASSGNQIGAIAGIASTHKGPSIKVYKDQDQYELWEFVFTPTASTVPGGGTGTGNGQGNGQGRGTPNQTGNGLGNQSTFGNQSNGRGGNQSQGVFGPGNGPQIFTPGPGR